MDDGLHPQFGGRWSAEPLLADGSRYPSMGFLSSAWIESKTGLQLDGWEVELLRRGMLYDPDSLDWVVRDVLVVGPEGIGKSSLWARVGLWFLDGPCLPPSSAPIPHPQPDIPVVSVALSLTEHVHRFARQVINDGPLAGRLEVENTRIYRSDNVDHRLAFPAGSGQYQQGKLPMPVILEEELHVSDEPGVKRDGAETIEVISSKRSKASAAGGMPDGRSHPKVQRWTITNPDDGDPESLLGRRWQHAGRVLAGEVDDPELLVVHYHAATPWDLDDPADLRRGIREAMPLSKADIEAIAAKYELDRQSPGWFRRMSGGLFVAVDEQVLPDEVARLERPDRPWPGPDEPVALAFDGARNRDSIALRACTVDGWGFEVAHWERPANVRADEYRYPRAVIDAEVRECLGERWPHSMIAADDTFFEDLVDDWEADFPDRVVRDAKREGPAAWELTRGLVAAALTDLEEGREPRWTHDGSRTWYRHMRNAREYRHPQSQKVKLVKHRDDGNHPIDALVADMYARRLAQHLEPPESIDDWRQALGLTGAEQET